jgi:hypothetical protein
MKTKTAAQPANHPFNVGDIIENRWGCTMTLYDFYQVVGVTKTSVRLQRMKKDTMSGGFGTPVVRPTFVDPNAEIFLKKVLVWKSGPLVNMKYGIGRLWNGVARQENHND